MNVAKQSTLSMAMTLVCACGVGMSPLALANNTPVAPETITIPDYNDIREGAAEPLPPPRTEPTKGAQGDQPEAALLKPGDAGFVNKAPSFSHLPGPTVVKNSGAYSKAAWAYELSDGDGDRGDQAMAFFVMANTNPRLFSDQPWVSYPDGTLHFTPAPGASGTAEVSLVLRDTAGTKKGGQDTSKVASIIITVLDKAVNQPPRFEAKGDVSVLQDSGTVSLEWATAIDDGDSLEQGLAFSVVSISEPSLFSSPPSINYPSGRLSFTPRAGKYGSAEVVVILKDDGGTDDGGQDSSAPVTFTITVEPDQSVEKENLAPVLSSQSVDVQAGQTASLNLYGADADGDEISYRVVSPPRHGQASIQGDVLSYTAFEDFNGLDTLEVVAMDGKLESNRATIRVTVSGQYQVVAEPLAPDVALDAPEAVAAGSTLTPSPVRSVASSAPVAESSASARRPRASGTSGTSSETSATAESEADTTGDQEPLSPRTVVALAPAASTSSPSPTLASRNSRVETDTDSENRSSAEPVRPQAESFTALARAGESTRIGLRGSAVSGEGGGYRIITPPRHGSVRLIDGAAEYQPLADYVGADSFSYVRLDGEQASEAASVSVWVDACYPSELNDACLQISESLASDGRRWDLSWAALPLASRYGVRIEQQGEVVYERQVNGRALSLSAFERYGDLQWSVTPLDQGLPLVAPARQVFAALAIEAPLANSVVESLALRFVGTDLAKHYRVTVQNPQGEAQSRILPAESVDCQPDGRCRVAWQGEQQKSGRYAVVVEALGSKGLVLSADRVNHVELVAPALSVSLASSSQKRSIDSSQPLALEWQVSAPVAEFELFVQHKATASVVLSERLSTASVCTTQGLNCRFRVPAQSQTGEYQVRLEAIGIDGARAEALASFEVQAQAQVATAGVGLNDTGIASSLGGLPLGRTDCVLSEGLKQDCEIGRDALAIKGELVKLGQGRAGFDFTKIAANGEPLEADAEQWHCLLDNTTGLMWELKRDPDQVPGGSLHDADDRFVWRLDDYPQRSAAVGGELCHAALSAGQPSACHTQGFVERVNEQGLCGAKDWRLPTRDELVGIIDFSRYGPALDAQLFSGVAGGGAYWSASPASVSAGSAWQVDFTTGELSWADSHSAAAVRLVRDQKP